MARPVIWTDSEIALLQDLWLSSPICDLAKSLQHSQRTIARKAVELQLPPKLSGWKRTKRSSDATPRRRGLNHAIVRPLPASPPPRPAWFCAVGRGVRFCGLAGRSGRTVCVSVGSHVVVRDLPPRTDLVDLGGGSIDWSRPEGQLGLAVALLAYCVPMRSVVRRLADEAWREWVLPLARRREWVIKGEELAEWIRPRLRVTVQAQRGES